ncbi:MAG: SIMPL domain-containing protein [Vicingaceae bacterium]|nr:SIMPL domain-containing protein [Vicingaceae bacterium]
MQKFFIALAVFFLTQNFYALEIKDRTITVSTSSEVLVVPEEIEIEITLQEQSGNAYLSKIEELFWEKLEVHQISKNNLSKDNVNVFYYWYYWWKNREAAKKSRKIVLKVSPKTNLLKLMKALDKNWVTEIKILSVSNKKIEQYKKDIQIKAMKAAKEKATYLLESIGEEVGRVVSAVELKSNVPANSTMQIEGRKYTSDSYRKVGGSFLASIPEIRLSYTIKSKFEIK